MHILKVQTSLHYGIDSNLNRSCDIFIILSYTTYLLPHWLALLQVTTNFMPICLTSLAFKNHRSIECPNSSVSLHDTWLWNFRLLPDSLCSVFLGIPNVFLYVSQRSPNFELLPCGPLLLYIANHLLPWCWFSQLVVALLPLLFPIHRHIFRL